jgi:hypothetical protein
MAHTTIEVDVESVDIARELVRNLSTKELVAFVIEMDEFAADWDVTKGLRDYFNGIEIPED